MFLLSTPTEVSCTRQSFLNWVQQFTIAASQHHTIDILSLASCDPMLRCVCRHARYCPLRAPCRCCSGIQPRTSFGPITVRRRRSSLCCKRMLRVRQPGLPGQCDQAVMAMSPRLYQIPELESGSGTSPTSPSWSRKLTQNNHPGMRPKCRAIPHLPPLEMAGFASPSAERRTQQLRIT